MKTIPLEEAINAVEVEPELPDEMPQEMKQALIDAVKSNEWDIPTELLRIIVRSTKDNIIERIKGI